MPKFIELLTSSKLWLANAELLASDDPYEGLPGAIQFPHRMWKTMEEVPEPLRRQILQIYGEGEDCTPEAAFQGWFMVEEQRCIMSQSQRRDFYLNCWHASDHESAAMWKIYGSPGAGVAVVTNGGRLETSLTANEEQLYLGAVRYRDPSAVQIGLSNGFDAIMVKRANYAYEQEVRLLHWATSELHDALASFAWNEKKLRFDDLIEDHRPVRPGMSLACEIDVLIESVIVSPFAPLWYAPMIGKLRERLGYKFPIRMSKLLQVPPFLL